MKEVIQYWENEWKNVSETEDITSNEKVFNFNDKTIGVYYTKEGEYLGQDVESKGLIFIISKEKYMSFFNELKNNPKAKTDYSVLRNQSEQLSINQDTFERQARIVYGESSAYCSSNTNELKNEMYAIANIYQKNSKAYGGNNAQAKLFQNTLYEKRNFTKMQFAVGAIINCFIKDGDDYSGGASMWDGEEQSKYGENETRGWVDGFELHMNTMGWSIKNEHYIKWKKNVGSKFIAPQERISPDNYTKGKISYTNKGKIRLNSTAVYGKTIFWKIV